MTDGAGGPHVFDWGDGRYRDTRWAAAFLAHLCVVCFGGAYAWHVTLWGSFLPPGAKIPSAPESLVPAFLTSVLLSAATAAALLLLLKANPRGFIWGTNALQIGWALATALGAVTSGRSDVALAAFGTAAFNASWLFLVRKRVAFASVVLHGACRVVFRHKGTLLLGFGGVLAAMTYAALAGMCALRYAGDASWTWALFLFGGYWTWQLILAVVHSAVCGVTAAWYFDGPLPPPCALWGALARSLTTSLGSLCEGALLVGAARTIGGLFSFMQTYVWGFGCVGYCGEEAARGTSIGLQYFTEYAYVQVMTYGKPFRTAAWDTWTLMRSCGLSAVVNDLLIGRTLTLTCLACSVGIAALAPLAFESGDAYLTEAGFGFVIASFILTTATQAVRSAVVALFVCYAEDPRALELSCPELAAELKAAVEPLTGSSEYLLAVRRPSPAPHCRTAAPTDVP